MTKTQPTAQDFQKSYFDSYYGNYRAQNPSYKLEFYRRTLRQFGPEIHRVLDVGCGLGAWLEHLRDHENWELYGTDLSAHAIGVNRERVTGVDFREASATEAPFDAAQFDAITALDVIEHVPDLDEVAEAVSQMLRPSGLFLFVVPVYDGLSGPLIKNLDRDPTHVHKMARKFWLEWVEQKGFELLHWQGIMRYLLPGGFYLHWPSRLWRHHGPAIIVVSRKT